MLVKEILSSVYALCGNCSEHELDYILVVEQYGITRSEMQHEQILGYKDSEIVKSEITFSDLTGIANDTLTDFVEDIVYLKFENRDIQEVPVGMLSTLKDSGQQAVAFYKDLSSGTSVAKVELAIPTTGILTVWFEPRAGVSRVDTDNTGLEDSYRYLLATRLAYNCMPYVQFQDPFKQANKPNLQAHLMRQSAYAKDLYLEKVNRIGIGSKPYSRLPFMSR